MNKIAISLIISVVALVTSASQELISDVQFDLAEIADSGSYYLYSYGLINPVASSGGVTAATMDISASSGTPAALPATGGQFRNLASGHGSPAPHAEVGPIIPTGWQASLRVSAKLGWYLPVGDTSPDSVSPGDTLPGFGIRSSYMPGLRSMSFEPTVEACCTEPIDTTEERWLDFPRNYSVSGWSVGPRYMPEEIDIELVQAQLAAVCSDPLWIDDTPLCAELTDSLDAIEDRLAINNYWGAAPAILGTRNIIWNEQAPGGDVAWNAQWLLRTNLAQLVENFPEGYQQSNVRLCASTESEANGYFTVTTTGPEQLVPSVVTIDAEVSGVDEPGSSCQMLWQMSLDGTALVDVKIKLDSLTAGSELDEFGWDYSGTPVVGPDSIVTSHDGNTTAFVHFIFVDAPQHDER